MKNVVSSTSAPAAIGPYSQAITANGFVFASGQLPIDPSTGSFPEGGVTAQSEQSIKNLKTVLTEAGCSLDDVVKTTVFLKDIGDFAAMNDVYSQHFKQQCPARSAIEVANLPKGAVVEIEAIAVLPK
ncbi:RidA family protein [Caproiciproducens sp.]|uniref:RidA family protein n=1 Tax=Caproiciproducens sp. TaxID=1954376 RepID=UPI0028A03B66|nr:RidA family protein [Caproiciproducens sp.]